MHAIGGEKKNKALQGKRNQIKVSEGTGDLRGRKT